MTIGLGRPRRARLVPIAGVLASGWLALSSPAALAPLAAQAASPPKADGVFERVYAAYVAGDRQAIPAAVTTEGVFDKVRLALYHAEREQWDLDRQPILLVFALDLAVHALNHNWKYWLDVVEDARQFAVSRRTPPGVNRREDDFELLWHKTALALLCGVRRPDFVQDHGATPLKKRISPAPSDPAAPRLIDPWIELVSGFGEEQWTMTSPSTLSDRAPIAIRYYDEAIKYDSTRAEALVRKSWLQTRLGHPADALATLASLRDGTDDKTVLTWSRLSRGRALEALDRPDEAARAYEEALTLSPQSQSPAVALAALELERGRFDEASKWADLVRHAPADSQDPWWQYLYGDRRFFQARFAALREMSRR